MWRSKLRGHNDVRFFFPKNAYSHTRSDITPIFFLIFKILIKNIQEIFKNFLCLGIFVQTPTEFSSNQFVRRNTVRLTLFVWYIYPSRCDQKLSLPEKLYYEVFVAGESKEEPKDLILIIPKLKALPGFRVILLLSAWYLTLL